MNWPLIARDQGVPTHAPTTLILSKTHVELAGASCDVQPPDETPRSPPKTSAFSTSECIERLLRSTTGVPTATVEAGALLFDVTAGLLAVRQARGSEQPVCFVARDPRRERRCVEARLLTEKEFDAWLDGTTSHSKFRVVMRSDGMEVAGAGGKVPGPDRYGPSILPRENRQDFVRLADVVRRLKDQVPEEEEMGVLASALTPFDDVVRALAAVEGAHHEGFTRGFVVIPTVAPARH